MVDKHRAAGRGGPGAVMGYKKLKAIVFSGSRKLKVGNEEMMDKLDHEAYHETLEVKDWACYGCPIACGRYTEIKEGKYKGDSGGGPEYETISAFGSKCEVDNLNAIAEANYIYNRMGLDTISAGQTIATAMEWYEKGLISSEDTDGIELEFGNDESMVEMIKKIAERTCSRWPG